MYCLIPVVTLCNSQVNDPTNAYTCAYTRVNRPPFYYNLNVIVDSKYS